MAKSKNDLDISVLIATYNRAEILRQTLESMTVLERDGLSVEFVVVDNNSSDHTKEVIESFTDRLPIRYLFESRPGKNCALNKALNEVQLGKLVAFTDDDVEPKKDWLKTIITITNHWLDYSVFGGKIYAIWPNGRPPKWTQSRLLQSLGFGVQDHGDSDFVYAPGQYPFGANLWVHREVFTNSRRFDESIGPRPKNRIMGSEISFLKVLAEDGYEMVYSPEAVVGHCIQACQLSMSNILKRAYRYGRGSVHWQGLPRKSLLMKHPKVWFLMRLGSVVKHSLLLALAMVLPMPQYRVMRSILAIIYIASGVESLRIASKTKT